MPISEKQDILLQTTSARDNAELLLRTLLDAKAQSERHLADIKQPDPFKQVTGKSAMDRAIADTQHAIEAFNRVIGDVKRNLTDEDLALLQD